MRPFRLVCTAFFFALLVFFLLVSILDPGDDSNEGDEQPQKGYKSRWSFGAPASLFPPSAIISLTDDNTTFFLARPALYGPGLPTDGLSGQLWVGSGFGDDTLLRGGLAAVGQAELGCGDIPGWSEEKIRFPITSPPSTPGSDADGKNKNQDASIQQQTIPAEDDDTDNVLHFPLHGMPLHKNTRKDTPESKKAHADIQSLQESAAIAGKVVLLSRGGCGFFEKTKWVQRRGGVALIVGDYTRGGHLIQMSAGEDTSNVTIPSIFTAYTSAHLLSSLVPSRSELKDSKKQQKVVVEKPATTMATAAATPTKAVNVPPAVKTAPKQPIATETAPTKSSWLHDFAVSIGLVRRGPGAGIRPPSSGSVSWVQSQDWDDNTISKSTMPGAAQILPKKTSGTSTEEEDFIIGVHDWRDPRVGSRPKDSKSTNKDSSAQVSSKDNAKPNADKSSKIPTSKTDTKDESWFHNLLTPGKPAEPSSEDAAKAQAMYKNNIAPHFIQDQEFKDDQKQKDTPEHEGLWITITPTSASANPFFDTLLVLVISPLVTLTIVYALLLVRSRIRRRRWRAPRSVVDRLPIRTYHTLSSYSSSNSSLHRTSPQHSSPTTPLLPSTSPRSRPRSATIAGIRQEASASLERATAHLSSREKPTRSNTFKRKFRSRQVECVVCLEEYIDGQSQVMSLPCGHEFHAECITPWLTTRRRTCPICKGDVVRSMDNSATGTTPSAALTENSSYTSLVLLNDHTPASPPQNTNTLQQAMTRTSPVVNAADEELQDSIAHTRNDSPTSAIPIPSSTSPAGSARGEDEDLAATLVGSRQSTDGLYPLSPAGQSHR